ncbi:hypothetical protein EV714DRAFT_213934 [Schizophyllum commune]
MSLQEPGMSALERLSPELQLLIIGNSTSQAVSCLSEASKALARVSRRRRLHTIKITAGGLSALQHWLEKECDGTACQCGANMRDEFTTFVRTLLLPKEWTTECRAYLALLAAMAPLQLQKIAASCVEDRSWWKAANKAWKVDDVGEVFASSAAISLRNPTRNGLLSVFKMRVRSMRGDLATLPCSLHLVGFSNSNGHSPIWGANDWPVIPSDEEDEHPNLERIILRANSLTVDVGLGIEDILANVYLLDLETLDVRTQGWTTAWSIVSRLLRDAKKLKVLRIRRGSAGRWSQIESDFLPAMTSLHVDWAIVSCIAQAVEFTPVNKVTLFVHKYDADDANDEEYDEARFCLSHTHWREVVFVEDPFWKLPGTLSC